jgi:hypothetical protein
MLQFSTTETDVASTCVHHSERPAHALCMSCHRAVCQECATTWEGIHYCTRCLAEQRQSTEAATPWAAGVLVLAAAAGLFWVVTRLMVWAGVLVADIL